LKVGCLLVERAKAGMVVAAQCAESSIIVMSES